MTSRFRIFANLFSAATDPRDLDVCRILFFSSLFLLFRNQNFASCAELPKEFYLPLHFFAWLGLPRPDPIWIDEVVALWLVSLVTSAVGLATQLSTAIAFILGFYLLGLKLSVGMIEHNTHLITVCMGALAFSRCGQHLSIDRALSNWFQTKNPALANRLGLPRFSNETWCIRVCQFSWCMVFFNAAIAKVLMSGFAVFDAIYMKSTLLVTEWWFGSSRLTVADSIREIVLGNDALAAFLGGAGWTVEFLSPLAFLLRSRLKFLFVAGPALMQIGVYFLLSISFAKMAPAYLFWVQWGAVACGIANTIKQKLSFPALPDASIRNETGKTQSLVEMASLSADLRPDRYSHSCVHVRHD